jgi:hypothetical protein
MSALDDVINDQATTEPPCWGFAQRRSATVSVALDHDRAQSLPF